MYFFEITKFEEQVAAFDCLESSKRSDGNLVFFCFRP